MSTEISLVSVGILVVACAALLVLDRIGRAQVATSSRKRHREPGSSPALTSGDWQVYQEPDRRPWWRRLLSGAGLTILAVLIAVAVAAVIGAVATAIYVGLESATS